MRERILLLSLHDVTPRHAARIARAEAFFRDVGVTHATYLLVPRYHGRWSIQDDAEFSRWCRAPRSYPVHWCLHGYLHQETERCRADPCSVRAWVKRRLLTAGEGEFLSLRAFDVGDRIDRGRSAYKACLGVDPAGFVAPAWLFNGALMPSLCQRGFAWTEDHWRIYDLRRHTTIDAPVLTWASRTRARQWGSIWLVSRLLQRWDHAPILRVAVHPCDFDYPSVVEAIGKAIVSALRDRRLDTYEHVLR